MINPASLVAMLLAIEREATENEDSIWNEPIPPWLMLAVLLIVIVFAGLLVWMTFDG